MTNTAVCSLFPLGTTLVTYNQWTNWEKPADQNWFKPLCFGRVAELDPGNQVWIDIDPLHPHGKVYGRRLCQITKIIGNPNRGGLWLEYTSGGSRMRINESARKFARLTNERAVRWWCDRHPLAYNPGYRHSEFIDPRKEMPFK